MKKFSLVIAALATIAVASISGAQARPMMHHGMRHHHPMMKMHHHRMMRHMMKKEGM